MDERPKLVYDDDCGFCTWSAAMALKYGAFEPVGFSELTATERARLPDEYEDCAHLLTDDTVYSCGRAAEAVLAHVESVPAEPFDFLRGFSDYQRLREDAYRWVADRRDLLGTVVSTDGPLGRE